MSRPNPYPFPRHTLELARKREAETGKPQYLVRQGELYVITDRMPMIGEWWTTDGIRHG